MNRLTIRNIHKLVSYFSPWVWYYSGWLERDDRYEFSFHHTGSGEKRVFVLSRMAYLSKGEWHYETHIVGRGYSKGCVAHSFISQPHNLAKRIIASI
jgi:lipocalin